LRFGEAPPISQIRVLVLEDHRSFREALAFLLELEDDIRVVAQAATLEDARSQLSGIDVAIVDLELSDGRGVDVIEALRAASPDAAVLVLSGHADGPGLGSMLDAGAAMAMSKSVDVSEIVTTVRRLGSGQPPPSKEALKRELRAQSRNGNGSAPHLTARELEVLQGIADGLSGREIARQLGISEATTRTHMENMRAKLGARSQVQALVYAVRRGYVSIR
jgi:two-component system, NarL family, nitrate/nitrite response regulator NarL